MSSSDIAFLLFILVIFSIAIMPSANINGLVAVLRSTSIGLLAAAGLLLCYLAFILMPR
jgi:hypothetical protein